MAVQRGRSKRRGDAYSEYVEPLNEARTKLADFFSILLDISPTVSGHYPCVFLFR
jgi:hypothetical protein